MTLRQHECAQMFTFTNRGGYAPMILIILLTTDGTLYNEIYAI